MAESNVRQRKKSASRKAQLLEIAAKIFAEEGYKETGIERILNQAGLTGPALYRHFSSKQEILDTICINSTQSALKTALEIQSEHDLSAEEILRKIISIRLDYLFSPMKHSAVLAVSQKAHLSSAARTRVLAMQFEFRTNCGALLKKIRPKLSDEEIKVIFFATQNMLIYSIWRATTRTIMPEEDHKSLLEKIIWDTLLG